MYTDFMKRPKLSSFLKFFLPIFLISAILPIFLFFVIRPPDIDFLTQADVERELRIWFEPPNVVTAVGKPVFVNVVASFDSESMLIPSISFNLSADQSLLLSESIVTYTNPFKGRINLASLSIKPTKAGKFMVSIPTEGIKTGLSETLRISTSPVTLVVK